MWSNFPLEHGQSGNIFFTLNGKLLKSFDLHYAYFCIEWYPVIGIDSFSPATVNFGGKQRFKYKESEMRLTSHDERDYFGRREVYNPYFITPSYEKSTKHFSRVRAKGAFLNLLKNVYRLEHAHAESKLIDADNWFDDLDEGDWINRLVNRRIEDGDDDDREGTVRRFIEQDALESWFAAHGVNFSGNDDDDDSDFGEDDDDSASISPSIFFQQEDPSRSRSNM